MVAIGDFEIRDREEMVRLALYRGWIHNAERMARAGGMNDPVVVLVAVDALDALPFRFNKSTRSSVMERVQRRAGCRRFVVGVVCYSQLVASNAAPEWKGDMEEMRLKGGTSVVCFTRTGQFLVSITPHEQD